MHSERPVALVMLVHPTSLSCVPSRSFPITALAAFCLLAHAAAALGQIDHRVNTGNALNAGRAHDANPGVGTGGFNLWRPGFNAGVQSDAIITGNVTGLANFKGLSPILQVNQFRDTLPSAGLDSFQQRSVGLSDIWGTSGPPPVSYYFGQTSTIAGAGQVVRGQNMPGSSMLASPTAAPLGVTSPLLRQTNPLTQDPIERRLQYLPSTPVAGISHRPLGPAPTGTTDFSGPLGLRASPATSPFQNAMGSSIFGADLAGRRPSAGGTPLPSEETEAEPPSPARIDSRLTPDSPGRESSESTEALAAAPPGGRLPFERPRREAIKGQTPSGGFARLGDDRFADLYNAAKLAGPFGIRQVRIVPDEKGDDSRTAVPGAAPIAPRPQASPGSPTAQTPPSGSSQSPPQSEEPSPWAVRLLADSVTSFVGRHESKLNEYLRQAEQELHRGEFYHASGLYDLAATIDPENPLPHLGKGHALAAAGDYLSSVYALCQGISRFPEIAMFKLDLPALTGQKDLFDRRRADLENRLESGSEDPQLRFLLGYLEYYSGLEGSGLRNLALAAKNAPADSPLARFHQLLTAPSTAPQAAPPTR